MVENTEGEILENLKKGMVDNTEGEVLDNLKKVNESLCRVVHVMQGPNSGETSDATKSISSPSLPRSSGPNTSSIFAEHQRLFGNAAVRTNPRVNQIAAALQFRPSLEQHSRQQLQERNERRKPQVDLVSEQSETNGLTSFVVWLKKMLAGYHLWKISLS